MLGIQVEKHHLDLFMLKWWLKKRKGCGRQTFTSKQIMTGKTQNYYLISWTLAVVLYR